MYNRVVKPFITHLAKAASVALGIIYYTFVCLIDHKIKDLERLNLNTKRLIEQHYRYYIDILQHDFHQVVTQFSKSIVFFIYSFKPTKTLPFLPPLTWHV